MLSLTPPAPLVVYAQQKFLSQEVNKMVVGHGDKNMSLASIDVDFCV